MFSRTIFLVAIVFFTLLSFVKCKSLPNSTIFEADKNRTFLKKLFMDLENEKSISEVIEMIKLKLISEAYKAEFKQIENISNGTFYYSSLPENLSKNKFQPTCYDQTRVVLSKDNNASDYIHANYVDGYNQKNAFIITQGRNFYIFVSRFKVVFFSTKEKYNS